MCTIERSSSVVLTGRYLDELEVRKRCFDFRLLEPKFLTCMAYAYAGNVMKR